VGREYKTDAPSVTTIIGMLEKKGLHEWYDWKGDKECKKIVDESTKYGHVIHELLKDIWVDQRESLETLEVKTKGVDLWPYHKIKEWILAHHPQPPLLVDPPNGLYSKKHDFYGTPDFVGDFIADWKTSSTPKTKDQKRERMFQYLMQLVGYAILFEENHGKWINVGYIVRANKKHEFEEVKFTNLKKWKSYFLWLRKLYRQYRGK